MQNSEITLSEVTQLVSVLSQFPLATAQRVSELERLQESGRKAGATIQRKERIGGLGGGGGGGSDNRPYIWI